MDGAHDLVHATAIAAGDRAALIRGPSGAGKSDLALRCLAQPLSPLIARTSRLVADDRTILTRRGAKIEVSSPETIRGLIEVRGLGVIRLPHEPDPVWLALVVDLVAAQFFDRFPAEGSVAQLLGLPVGRIDLDPFEASAPLKLLLALERALPMGVASTASP